MKLGTKAALLGGIPLVALSGIAAILAAQDEPSEARSTLAAGVITGSVMAASVIYERDSWSLTRQTAAHFAVVVATVYPALCLSGWFRTQTIGDFAAIGGYFLAVGLISWTAAYLVASRLVPWIKDRDRS